MPNISDIMIDLFAWISSWFAGLIETLNVIPNALVLVGNGFFNTSVGMCTMFVGRTPMYYEDVWAYVKGLALGDIAIGIASDLYLIFFTLSLIDYTLAVRNKVDPEDIFKMFARAILANVLIFNMPTLIEELYVVVGRISTMLVPETPTVLEFTQLPAATGIWTFLMDMVLGIVYLVVMVMLSYKVINSFFERFIWIFFSLPFAAPAFAGVAGSGKFTSTAKAYIRFCVASMVEFIGFAILVNILTLFANGFISTIVSRFMTGIPLIEAIENFVLPFINYIANLFYASFVCNILIKVDVKVKAMLGL